MDSCHSPLQDLHREVVSISVSATRFSLLAAALRLNTCIKELYLSDNELCMNDAIQLASILRSNTTLQLLDVSNNNLQDAGVGHLSDGLTEQVPTVAGGGEFACYLSLVRRQSELHFPYGRLVR